MGYRDPRGSKMAQKAPEEFQIEFEIWIRSQIIKQLSLILLNSQTDSLVIVTYFDEK